MVKQKIKKSIFLYPSLDLIPILIRISWIKFQKKKFLLRIVPLYEFSNT